MDPWMVQSTPMVALLHWSCQLRAPVEPAGIVKTELKPRNFGHPRRRAPHGGELPRSQVAEPGLDAPQDLAQVRPFRSAELGQDSVERRALADGPASGRDR